jgi:hypothetical protein
VQLTQVGRWISFGRCLACDLEKHVVEHVAIQSNRDAL